jgi:peptidoglycan-N-acetylglucosamine deacetylase
MKEGKPMPFIKHSVLIGVTIFLTIFCNAHPGKSNEIKQSAPVVRRIIALTFDDGPSSQYTPQILDILRDNGIRATFFVIGRNVQEHPEKVKREAVEGHVIGNHTWSHPFFAPLESHQQLKDEINKTEQAVMEACSVRTRLFRPPHGWRSPWMIKEVEGMGYDIVNWTVDPKDWKHPTAAVIVKRVEHAPHSSAIVLMHDGLELKEDPGQSNTVTALKEIVADYKKKGYQFVTISELLADPEFADEYRALFKVIAEPKATYK